MVLAQDIITQWLMVDSLALINHFSFGDLGFARRGSAYHLNIGKRLFVLNFSHDALGTEVQIFEEHVSNLFEWFTHTATKASLMLVQECCATFHKGIRFRNLDHGHHISFGFLGDGGGFNLTAAVSILLVLLLLIELVQLAQLVFGLIVGIDFCFALFLELSAFELEVGYLAHELLEHIFERSF